MRVTALIVLLFAACTSAVATPAPAHPAAPSPSPLAAFVPASPVTPTPELAAAMAHLDFMRGVWRGPASGSNRDGSQYQVTQTERVGPMLGGDVIVIEGRGYKDDGSTGFNAFAVVSYDLRTATYEMRSYAMGYAGTFELKLTATGYVWEVPAGPNAVVRYTATIHGDSWREVGELVTTGQPPLQTFEMNLTRVGATDWPLATPVSPNE